MFSCRKLIVPVLPVPAPPRLTPVPPEVLTAVFWKSKFADELVILIPPPVVLAVPVARLNIAPATLTRLIPVPVAPEVDKPPEKFAVEDGPVSVPVVRLKAGPVLTIPVSPIKSVPKLVPMRAVAVATEVLSETPRIVLPDPKVMLLTAASMFGFMPPVEGSRLVPEGADKPLILSSEA